MSADPNVDLNKDEPVSDVAYGAHAYDGIVENDNPLPGWWKWTLYGAIVFAVLYWFDVQMLGAHPTASKVYAVQAAAEAKARAEQAMAAGTMTDDILVAMSKDPSAVDRGRQTFVSTCAPCHKSDGGGAIGPNLTDDTWLHGGKPTDLHRSVHEGWPLKGMPSWAPALGEQRVTEVVAFLLTIQNTNVAGGKAPQGEKAQ